MKEIFSPSHGRTVKFGRRIPKVPPRTFKLARYLDLAQLPAVPASSDYTPPALPALRDIMGNDQYGDCVLACGGHLVGVETGNAGNLQHATLAQVLAQYTAIAGFNPDDPSTDTGVNIIDALNYWSTHGFTDGTKALGHLQVDATNVAELKAAMYLFENLVFGIALPDKWVNPMPSGDGFTWDAASPDSSNGHCVLGVGHNSSGIQIDTWGLFGTLTFAAIAKLCVASGGGEVHVIITPDQLAKGAAKAPNGVAWEALVADFDSIGGTVPIPVAPVPSPAPTPAPGVAVTLAQATSWATAGIAKGLPLMTRSQAEAAAKAGLTSSWPK